MTKLMWACSGVLMAMAAAGCQVTDATDDLDGGGGGQGGGGGDQADANVGTGGGLQGGNGGEAGGSGGAAGGSGGAAGGSGGAAGGSGGEASGGAAGGAGGGGGGLGGSGGETGGSGGGGEGGSIVPSDECVSGCATFAACATQDEPVDLCPGLPAESVDALAEQCAIACTEDATILGLIEAIPDCAQLIQVATDADDGFGEACGGGIAPPGDCVTACNHLADCATQDEPEDLCPGLPADSRDGFAAECVRICADDPTITAVVSPDSACDELVQTLAVVDDGFAGACFGEGPPPGEYEEIPECAAVGALVAQCVVAECGNAGPIEEGLAGLWRMNCNFAVASGDLTPEILAGLADADCANGAITELVSSATEGLVDFCTDGSQVDLAVCETVCGALGPCIPEGQGSDLFALSELPVCIASCYMNAPPEDIVCITSAMTCDEQLACIDGGDGGEPPPPPPPPR